MDFEVTKAEATARIEKLVSVMPHLPAKDHKFAQGLMASTIEKGPTHNRLHWLGVLVARAEQNMAPAPAGQAAPAAGPQVAHVGDFHKVMALFDLAKQNLKKPKIRLQLADRQPIVLAVAGEKAKEPGTIDVSDGGSYGFGKWYGRVTLAGDFTKSAKHEPQTMEEVEALLIKLGASPAQVAAEFGKLTGRCCFCNLKLSDPRSTAVGFGKICAGHYGLLDAWKESDAVLTSREALEVAG